MYNSAEGNEEADRRSGVKLVEGLHTGFSEGQDDFRLLVDTIQDYGIFMLDPSGKVLTWNRGAQRIQGYQSSEVVGTHFSRFYTKEDQDRGHPSRELAIAAQQGRYEEEGWRVRKDGSQFWTNVVITAIRDQNNNLRGFGKITRDLTDRKLIEGALRESEERFRLIVESAKDYAILMLDPKGFIVSWNQGAERIKGWKSGEILGRHFSVFYLPEEVQAGKTELELEVAAREGRFEDLGWRVRKDGSRFWANVIITALRDDKGILRGFSKLTRDITEKKNAEDELKKAYDELEERVEDRTRALLVANRELESFSYSVSHDLRAPLRSMDGFSQALLKYYDDKLDDRGKDYLRRIRESAQRMGQLIEDILNLSKLGRADFQIQEVDLSAMVEKIASELKKSEPCRDVRFTIDPEIRADCDPSLIRLALENLIQNSWKYTSKHPTARIQFGATRDAELPVYFIKDDGAGFDMAFIDKLFNPFQRLHLESDFSGTGVGLASVKRIIQRHGGDVWAQGEIEKGATIYFTLGSKKGSL